MHIKNIILDLGGVLLNIDYNKTIDAFEKLGIHNFEEMYSQAAQNDLFNNLETGHISEKEFLVGVSQYLPEKTTHKEIIDAWNKMLLDLPAERLEFLKELKQKYNTALLSNTNAIHIKYFESQFKQKYNQDNLNSYFNSVYYSFEMGMRKPNPEIFEKVCALENFNPSETLFIDDSIQHIKGAKKVGIHAYHLDIKKTNVKELLHTVLT